MILVSEHKLNEDFIDRLSDDDLSGDDNISVEDNGNFDHDIVILVSYRTKDDVRNIQPVFKRLCNMLGAMMNNAPFISRFYGEVRTTNPEVEFRSWPQYAKHPLNTIPMTAGNPASILDKSLRYMEEHRERSCMLMDFHISFDFCQREMTPGSVFRCVLLFENMRNKIKEFSRNYCSSDVSMAFTFDGQDYYWHSSRNKFDNKTLEIYSAVARNSGVRTIDLDYAKNMLERIQKYENDKFDVQANIINQIRGYIDNFDQIAFSMAKLKVDVDRDRRKITCTTPENHNVNIESLNYAVFCMFTWMKYQQPDDYELSFYVNGTLTMWKRKKWLNNNYRFIKFINRINAVGTPFSMLNRDVLPYTKVNEICLVNPQLNTVGGDNQKVQINPNTWESPDVKITAEGFDISREETTKPLRYYLVAKKRK